MAEAVVSSAICDEKLCEAPPLRGDVGSNCSASSEHQTTPQSEKDGSEESLDAPASVPSDNQHDIVPCSRLADQLPSTSPQSAAASQPNIASESTAVSANNVSDAPQLSNHTAAGSTVHSATSVLNGAHADGSSVPTQDTALTTGNAGSDAAGDSCLSVNLADVKASSSLSLDRESSSISLNDLDLATYDCEDVDDDDEDDVHFNMMLADVNSEGLRTPSLTPRSPSPSSTSTSQQLELRHLRASVQQLTAALAERSRQLQTAHSNQHQQLQRLQQQCDATVRERDAAVKDRDRAVLRFAERERHLVGVQRQLATAEKNGRQTARERDMLSEKLSAVALDVNRLRQNLDTKCNDIKVLSKENNAIRDELQSKELKIKWLQNRMSQEQNAFKETRLRMEKMQNELKNAQETIDSLKQQQQHESSSEVSDLGVSGHSVDTCDPMADDNQTLPVSSTQLPHSNVHCDGMTCEDCERQLSELRHQVTSLESQFSDVTMSAKTEAEALQGKLQKECERVAELESRVVGCAEELNDALSERDQLTERHADMLQHTLKLTENNVQLQVSVSSLTAQSESLETELGSLRSRLEAECVRVNDLTNQLKKQQISHTADMQAVRDQLSEACSRADQMQLLYDESHNSVAILKKRYQMALKERAGELARLRQKCDAAASACSPTSAPALSASTTSASDVSNGVSPPPLNNGTGESSSCQLKPAAAADNTAAAQQQLVEQLVRVRRQRQRLKQRLAELLEQNSQLVEEVRRKSQLLNSYLVREQAGTLSSHRMDENKLTGKAKKMLAELMRMGGIMASVYGSQQRDETMTLDLSLEINRKLQALLEDTLLKNITLKENLNILGQEIDKLTAENRRLQSADSKNSTAAENQ